MVAVGAGERPSRALRELYMACHVAAIVTVMKPHLFTCFTPPYHHFTPFSIMNMSRELFVERHYYQE